MICQMIGVFLSCTATGPMTDIMILQPRTPAPDTYITSSPYVGSGDAASTTRFCDGLVPAERLVCDAGWMTREELIRKRKKQ